MGLFDRVKSFVNSGSEDSKPIKPRPEKAEKAEAFFLDSGLLLLPGGPRLHARIEDDPPHLPWYGRFPRHKGTGECGGSGDRTGDPPQ